MKPLFVALLLIASTAYADYAKRENGGWTWYYQYEVTGEWGDAQTLTRFKAETATVDDFRAFYPNLFAASFREQFQTDFPDELTPPAQHVWQLFVDHYVPDRADAAAFEGLLSRLGDVDYRVRLEASYDLRNPKWSRLAWTIDLQNRSPEVRSRIEAYRNHFHPLTGEEIDRLGEDRDYLRDAEAKADPVLRARIEQRLDELNG